jgi:hypothetical protein
MLMHNMKMLLSAVAVFGVGLGTANASTVTLGGQTWDTTNSGTLTLGAVVPSGNQPMNAPCVICGANQPGQPANFGYNDYQNGGNLSAATAFSDQGSGGRNTLANNTIGPVNPGYQIGSGSPFLAFLLANGDSGNNLGFSIGVDVNDNGNAQTLNAFYFLDVTTHTVLASFTGGTTGNVPSVNNGTGFPDYSITGSLLNLADVNAGDTIAFVAALTGLNDGPDSFFVESAPVAATPLPAALPMFLGGLAGLWGLVRRRKVKASNQQIAFA